MPKRKPKSKAGKQKVMGDEMRKFFKGALKSGSGKKVTDPAQAKAIGLSESGQSRRSKRSRKRKKMSSVGKALST